MFDIQFQQWHDESALGYSDPSPIEGRAGHTLLACDDKLLLYGGFVGDGYDGAVYSANLAAIDAAIDALAQSDSDDNTDEDHAQ